MPKPSLIERLTGKRRSDIRLPNDTGHRDKRLPPPTKVEKIRDGLDMLRTLGTPPAPKKGRR